MNQISKSEFTELKKKLGRELDDLKAAAEEANYRVEEKQDEIRAVELTESLLYPAAAAGVLIGELHGLTQKEALVKIAKANKGVLHTKAAKSVMLRAGLIKSSKNASQIIFNTVLKSGLFVKAAPGEYELLEQEKKPLEEFASGTPKKS